MVRRPNARSWPVWEILAHLFERDHVVVYLVYEDYYGHLSVGPGNVDENGRLYHLVIQFTSECAMERHSLIRLQ